MAELSYLERITIEKFLDMQSGFVLDFTNKTFQEFIGENINCDIYSEKYDTKGTSKANRLRSFFTIESKYNIGVLLQSFCDYWIFKVNSGETEYLLKENLYKECIKIAEKLKKDNIVENIDAIKPNSNDRDFNTLAKSIRDSIEKNEPEVAIDRLHTFLIKYVRCLCDNNNLSYSKDEPLHSLFGKYLKFIKDNNYLESNMTEKILKYSLKILDEFNNVRNNKSYAHDNPILNYHESVLILNNISNTIKFIETIENRIKKSKQPKQEDWDDLPF